MFQSAIMYQAQLCFVKTLTLRTSIQIQQTLKSFHQTDNEKSEKENSPARDWVKPPKIENRT